MGKRKEKVLDMLLLATLTVANWVLLPFIALYRTLRRGIERLSL